MPRKTTSLAILFADIAKSTRLYEILGDADARNLIGNCLLLFSEITQRHGGSVIKTIGDEILCTFANADVAIEAAKDMHRRLAHISLPDRPDVQPPNIYIGVHVGAVIMESDDVYGEAVNIAARMVSLAKQRQILTTEETVKALSAENQSTARRIDRTTIEGFGGVVDIYEIIWEQQDVTVMLGVTLENLALRACLELCYGGKTVRVDQNNPDAAMGRQDHNDLIVNDKRVSRSHARIEYRRGRFMLIDQSTNGTYVGIQGRKIKQLKKDEIQLHGYGIIGLGREVNETSTSAIRYTIRF